MSLNFLIVSLFLAILPGTGVVFALSCGLSHGQRGAFWGAVAGAVGVLPHITAAALGLSALLHAGSAAYEVLRLAGAGYLVYLAWQSWRDASTLDLSVKTAPVSALAIVKRGVLLNLLNPKLTVFFLAFLPQFLAPDSATPTTDAAMMGLVLVIETFVVFLGYGLLASSLRSRLSGNRTLSSCLNKGLSVIFAGLALRVLLPLSR